MKRYYFSPFFEVKNVFQKCYAEHKYTKQIILLPAEISDYFTDVRSYLFGLDEQTVNGLKEHRVFDFLLEEQVLVDETVAYSDISRFFVRPQHTYAGLPTGNIDELLDSLAIMGVPYRQGNANNSNLHNNGTTARKYGHKYNLLLPTFAYASEIKGRAYDFVQAGNIFDLGDLYISEREDLSAVVEKIADVAAQLILQDNRFIAIGGDHSVTYPLVKGARTQVNDLVCVHIDAHNDLFLLPECHFADLAPSHSSVIGKLLREGTEVHSVGLRDFVNIDSLAFAGHPLYSCYFTRSDAQFLEHIDTIITRLAGRKIYLSIDVDVLDEKYFSSVTDPLPDGISPEALLTGFSRLNECTEIVSMDIVEANLQPDHPTDIHRFLNLLTEIINIYHGKTN